MSDYSRLSFREIDSLDIVDFLILRRDAYIDRLERTDKGMDYLKTAWRLQQTEIDREGLRKKFGTKEKVKNGGRQDKD